MRQKLAWSAIGLCIFMAFACFIYAIDMWDVSVPIKFSAFGGFAMIAAYLMIPMTWS